MRLGCMETCACTHKPQEMLVLTWQRVLLLFSLGLGLPRLMFIKAKPLSSVVRWLGHFNKRTRTEQKPSWVEGAGGGADHEAFALAAWM